MTQEGKVTTLAAMKQTELPVANVTMGFFTSESFDFMQRVAIMFSSSALVPKTFQHRKDNPNGLANTLIALNMANRMGADPIMVMQNLYPINGTPSWSSKFLIATINSCGRFSSLRYEWKNEQNTEANDYGCRAWAIEKETGERLDGSWVTWAMVRAEGWDKKNGSKWKTMPEQMFIYRAAAFWQRAYAPEVGMGLRTIEEEQDIIDISPKTGEILSISTENIRKNMKKAAAVDTAQPTPPADPSVEASLSDKEQGNQPEQEPSNSASNHVEKQEHPVDHQETPTASQQFSPLVKKFMHEINEATKKGSLGVDQWRAHHNKRVERECGGSSTKDYRDVMDYAEMVYREVVESEKEGQEK